MTDSATAPEEAILRHSGGSMLLRRLVVGVAVLAVLLAVIVGFVLAPGAAEQAAVMRRSALTLAATLYSERGPGAASDALGSSPSSDPATMRAQLRYAAEAGLVDRHFAILSGSDPAVLSAEELRAAHRFYAARSLPQQSASVLQMLASRDLASVEELLLLARARTSAGETDAALAIAHQMAERMRPGDNPAAGLYVINTLSHGGARREAEAFVAKWLGASAPTAMVLATAPAMIQAGEADLAVSALRSRRSASPEASAAFDYALRIAAQAEPELRTELTRDLLETIPLLSGEARAVAIHDLFAFGDIDQVISAIGGSGAWRAEPMRAAFVQKMISTDRKEQLRDMLLGEAAAGAPAQAARQLAEIGFPREAAQVLQTAAAQEGPTGQAMTDLLYIWSRHRIEPDLDWLVENAAMASAEVAPLWVDRIAQTRSIDSAMGALTRLQQTARPEARTSLAVMQARYLGWEGDSQALRRALSNASQRNLSYDQAAEIFYIACTVHEGPSARRAAKYLDPSPPAEASACLSQLSLDDAREALAAGNSAAALKFYAEAINFDELGAQDSFDYAQALEDAGNEPAARRRYETALAALPPRPSEPRALILRAAILQKLGRTHEARDILEVVQRAAPDNRGVQLMLADLYVGLENYSEARRLLEPLYQDDPGNRSLQLKLADLYINSESYPEARQMLEVAYDNDPANRSVQLKLADLYINLRTYPKAREILETVYRADPANRSVQLKLADLYVNLGSYREALALTSDGATQIH